MRAYGNGKLQITKHRHRMSSRFHFFNEAPAAQEPARVQGRVQIILLSADEALDF
jgi:hypothetical protein